MPAFNLVHQPWIPVSARGATTKVSLLEAVTRAHEIDGLGLEDPLQVVAVFRQVILPVVLDALGVPRSEGEWAARWESGKFDVSRLTDYLEEHAARFDLFDATAPFAQVADLHTAKHETKPVSLLLPAVAAGNNVPLFSGATDATPPSLTPAEAACALVSVHCWDTAAIKSGAVGDPNVKAGKTTGNPKGPVGELGVTIPMGRTLADTLVLNMPIVRQGLRSTDLPQWRSRPVGPEWSRRPAAGLLDLLTFQSRRVRLIPHVASDGGTTVSEVVLSAGDRLAETPEVEPHTMWRIEAKPKAGVPPRRPVRHLPGRAAWRGLSSLLATKTPIKTGLSTTVLLDQLAGLRAEGLVPDTLPLQVLTVGVTYGNQSAVIEDVLVDLIPIPVLALTTDGPMRAFLHEIVADAEAVQRAGNELGDDIRQAAGGDKLPWDKSLRVGDALVQEFTSPVRRLLAGLQRNPELVEEAAAAWAETARGLCLAALERAAAAAPPQAFLGRDTKTSRNHLSLSDAEARFRAVVFARFPRTLEPPTAGGAA